MSATRKRRKIAAIAPSPGGAGRTSEITQNAAIKAIVREYSLYPGTRDLPESLKRNGQAFARKVLKTGDKWGGAGSGKSVNFLAAYLIKQGVNAELWPGVNTEALDQHAQIWQDICMAAERTREGGGVVDELGGEIAALADTASSDIKRVLGKEAAESVYLGPSAGVTLKRLANWLKEEAEDEDLRPLDPALYPHLVNVILRHSKLAATKEGAAELLRYIRAAGEPGEDRENVCSLAENPAYSEKGYRGIVETEIDRCQKLQGGPEHSRYMNLVARHAMEKRWTLEAENVKHARILIVTENNLRNVPGATRHPPPFSYICTLSLARFGDIGQDAEAAEAIFKRASAGLRSIDSEAMLGLLISQKGETVARTIEWLDKNGVEWERAQLVKELERMADQTRVDPRIEGMTPASLVGVVGSEHMEVRTAAMSVISRIRQIEADRGQATPGKSVTRKL